MKMGQVYANIEISNAASPQLNAVPLHALVDTSALFLCIPASVALQLNLSEFEKREVTIEVISESRTPKCGRGIGGLKNLEHLLRIELNLRSL